ncbi:MAG: radical SAM protein [Clostridia bacterium]|nr:radical SAM protein [Clostridia bacterium]
MKGINCLGRSRQGLLSRYSHVYVEKDAYNYPYTYEILDKFSCSQKIIIDEYRNLFNRPRQDFFLQKQSQKLILAVKPGDFLYPGPDVCEDFGFNNFYYCSTTINCIYNCDYCFLQGMYNSGNIVVFVNIDDFFDAVDQATADKKVYLCISYDSDILALENITGQASRWIKYARGNDNLLIEIKTKSANYSSIATLEPTGNVILAWTLSPHQVWQKYEHCTPSLSARIKSAKDALQDGWKVRLSIEPVIEIEGWEKVYSEFIHQIFQEIDADRLLDINSGVFRMSKDQVKRIKKMRKDTDVFAYPMMCKDGIMTYMPDREKYMKQFIYQHLLEYCNKEKVFIYEDSDC